MDSVIEFLGTKNKNLFSRWDPVYFRDAGIDFIAYLSRFASCDYALIEVTGGTSDDGAFFLGELNDFSLKDYSGGLDERLMKSLASLVSEDSSEELVGFFEVEACLDGIVASHMG